MAFNYTLFMLLNNKRISLPVSGITFIVKLFLLTGFYSFLSGCATTGSIDISDFFRKGKNPNWSAAGGGITRDNFREHAMQFPLQTAWMYKATTAVHDMITVSDSLVFFGAMDGKIFVVDLRNGKIRGTMKFSHPAMGGITVEHHNMFLGLSSGKSTFYSYNVYERRYNFIRNLGAIESNPLYYDDYLYITTQKGMLYCLNAKDGNIEWSRDLQASCQSSPALLTNTVYTVSDKGVITALNRFRGYVLWTLDLRQPVLAGPAADKNALYLAAMPGTLYAIDPEKGSIIWKQAVSDPAPGYLYSTPAVGTERIFVGSTNGYLYALDKASGKPVWKFKTNAVISASPVATPDYVFVGSQDTYFYAIDIRSGECVWSYKTSGRIKTSPALYGDYILIAAENKNVYAFKSAGVK